MVPLQRLTFEHHSCEDSKYCKRYHFLDDFQLHQIERTSVVNESYSVCRYLCAIFEECHSPREENDQNERPV